MQINLKDLLNIFSEVFNKVDINEFNLKTNFKENDEWDSLAALHLITILDENYKKKFLEINY